MSEDRAMSDLQAAADDLIVAYKEACAATGWAFEANTVADFRAALIDAAPRAATEPEKPPVPWSTIRQDASERGLFAVVDEAMVGRKLAPSRRRLIVGNIVMAVAKWRESFRDCGCWKTADGFALCDWHERAFRPQREEAERLAAPRAATEPRTFDDDETWDWGIVIDALVEHRASAEARKGENPESSSDVRADICKRMIEAIVADADARYQRVAAPRATTEPPLTRERLAAALHTLHPDQESYNDAECIVFDGLEATDILAALHGAEPAPEETM